MPENDISTCIADIPFVRIDERGHTLNGGEFCEREFPGLEQVARGLALQKNIPIGEDGP